MSPSTEQVAAVYVAMFAARDDVYSMWTPSGWRPQRADLTADVALAGLTGSGPSVSGYMIAPGSVSHVFAVDFDTDNGQEQAFALAREMDVAGVPAYVETSRRGAHLWVVLDREMPAKVIRKGIRAFMAAALLPNDDKRIELRPGSDTIGADGLGHALRMPLMPHPKTGQRGFVYDASGVSLGAKLTDVLVAWDIAPAMLIETWASRWRPPIKEIPKEYRNPRRPYPDDGDSASQLLAELWHSQPVVPGGREVRCPAHEDRNASLYVFPDDKRVLCHSSVCILNNNERGRGTYELRKLAPAHV